MLATFLFLFDVSAWSQHHHHHVTIESQGSPLVPFLYAIVIALFVAALLVREPTRNAWLQTLTLTFTSISMIASGNGMVEYHFSVFVMLAIVAFYDQTRFLLVSVSLFAFQHIAGFFLFPLAVYGNSNYSFIMVLMHLFFVVLLTTALYFQIQSSKKMNRIIEEERAAKQLILQQLLEDINQSSNQVTQLSDQVFSQAQTGEQAHEHIHKRQGELVQQVEQHVHAAENDQSDLMRLQTEIDDVVAAFVGLRSRTSHSRETTEKTIQDISNATKRMEGIDSQPEEIVNRIEQLQTISQQIAKDVEDVEKTARQSHILSINTGIEAAHTHAGKHFAVIAEEIRKLAVTSQHTGSIIAKSAQSIEHVATRTSTLLKEQEQTLQVKTDALVNTETHLTTMFEETKRLEERITDGEQSMKGMQVKYDDVTKMLSNHVHTYEELLKRIEAMITAATAQHQQNLESTQSIQQLVNTVQSLRTNIQTLNNGID